MALIPVYSIIGKTRKEESGNKIVLCKLTIGDGVQTYGTGVALDAKKLGCPNEIKSLAIVGNAQVDSYMFKYDPELKVIHILDDADPYAELIAGATPAAFSIYVEVIGW